MDPYKVLGVAKNASDSDIRGAFRKLAKELHPDLNPDNKTAAERFKKVSGAYEVLSDKQKRAAFDRGEIDGNGEPRRGYAAHGMGGGPTYGAQYGRSGAPGGSPNFGFGDIFDDIFAGQRGGFSQSRQRARAPRGADVRYTLEVDFLESVNGTKKRVTLPEGGVLDLAVPEGVTDGQVLRLRGKGASCPGGVGPSGDALVEIKVRAHSLFRREEFDIRSEIPITLDEAVLGGKIEVSTIGGRVQLTLPAGTSSGRVFRLKGKGILKKPGGSAGDHLVCVRIVLPPESDKKLAEFMESWRKSHRYEPGQR